MNRRLPALALLLTLPLLSGCITAAVGAASETGVSLAENRSLGRKMDDNVIFADVSNKFAQADFKNLIAKVTINVRFGRVMLTGVVPDSGTAQKATELAWKAKGVLEVINAIQVVPDFDMGDYANDSLVKQNLVGRILITKDVWEINYGIDVVGGTAYIIGRTHDRAELNRVLNLARATKGVHKVVSYLQVASELPDNMPVTGVSPGQVPGPGGAPAELAPAGPAPSPTPSTPPAKPYDDR
ncbi:MAG: BON domain-containing protein [Alphaproteobacteria bacterium]